MQLRQRSIVRSAGIVAACIGLTLLGWTLGLSCSAQPSARPLKVFFLDSNHSRSGGRKFPMQCTLLPVDPMYTSPGPRLGSGGNKTYNPGAVWHPEKGWLVIMRFEPVHWGPAWAYTMKLGKDPSALDLEMGNVTQKFMSFDPETLDPGYVERKNASFAKAHDLRPFMWKGKVYASHAMWLGSKEGAQKYGVAHWQCITELDFDTYVMKLEYCFDRMPIRKNTDNEKNWSFQTINGTDDLMIVTQLAPCATYFRFDPSAPKGLQVVDMICYQDHWQEIFEATGMPMDGSLHNSGHFVDFPKSLQVLNAKRQRLGRDAYREDEWFVMAHVKKDGWNYQHWGLRISKATLQITHVSRGVIISTMMVPKPEMIVVFSHHFIKVDGINVLMIFFGKNDDSNCVTQVDAEALSWYRVRPGTHLNWTDTGTHNYEFTEMWDWH